MRSSSSCPKRSTFNDRIVCLARSPDRSTACVGRRAQLRYREKQRQQREDDRRTIEELSARVAALETDRAELARRNALLTSVAAIKEAQNPVQPPPVNATVSPAAHS